jgi:hypothetical protein
MTAKEASILQVAKERPVVKMEPDYTDVEIPRAPELDDRALRYCLTKHWVQSHSQLENVNVAALSPRAELHSLVTRLLLTDEGEAALYEYEQQSQAQPLITESNLPTSKASDAVRALEAMAGDEGGAVLRIVHSEKSASDKASAICDIDKRFLAWNSTKWAELFGVKPSAIRKSPFWKKDRPERIAKERDDQ